MDDDLDDIDLNNIKGFGGREGYGSTREYYADVLQHYKDDLEFDAQQYGHYDKRVEDALAKLSPLVMRSLRYMFMHAKDRDKMPDEQVLSDVLMDNFIKADTPEFNYQIIETDQRIISKATKIVEKVEKAIKEHNEGPPTDTYTFDS